jgi:hypothetical protein
MRVAGETATIGMVSVSLGWFGRAACTQQHTRHTQDGSVVTPCCLLLPFVALLLLLSLPSHSSSLDLSPHSTCPRLLSTRPWHAGPCNLPATAVAVAVYRRPPSLLGPPARLSIAALTTQHAIPRLPTPCCHLDHVFPPGGLVHNLHSVCCRRPWLHDPHRLVEGGASSGVCVGAVVGAAL